MSEVCLSTAVAHAAEWCGRTPGHGVQRRGTTSQQVCRRPSAGLGYAEGVRITRQPARGAGHGRRLGDAPGRPRYSLLNNLLVRVTALLPARAAGLAGPQPLQPARASPARHKGTCLCARSECTPCGREQDLSWATLERNRRARQAGGGRTRAGAEPRQPAAASRLLRRSPGGPLPVRFSCGGKTP
jgi:hypothetical protein